MLRSRNEDLLHIGRGVEREGGEGRLGRKKTLNTRVNASQPSSPSFRPLSNISRFCFLASFPLTVNSYLSHLHILSRHPSSSVPSPSSRPPCRSLGARSQVRGHQCVNAWLRLSVPSQCQLVGGHKLRAECHGEL